MNSYTSFANRSLPTMRVSAALIGLTVPISTALDNVLLAILLIGFIFNAPATWQVIKNNPVARAAVLLFGCLLLATLYGATPIGKAFGGLGKYVDLAFIPLLIYLFTEVKSRQLALHFFMSAMGLTLLLSYLLGFHVIAPQSWFSEMGSAENPVIFHSHITQNNMMAFAAFIGLLQAREAATSRLRMAWGAFAILAICNVLFMVQGRTGYLILLVLLGWFAWASLARYALQRGKSWGWTQSIGVLLLSTAVVVSAYFASPRLHERVSLVVAEVQAWQPNQEDQSSSAGTRLNFYYNAVQIVAQHPLLGVGTGGFEAAFTEQIKGTNLLTTPNPHNEFLLIAAQLGLLGLVVLLYLFVSLWRAAPLLQSAYLQDAARGLVFATMVNCAFNSALHDHADGLFFAWMTALLFATLQKTGRR
jgi:O-antigen ligase